MVYTLRRSQEGISGLVYSSHFRAATQSNVVAGLVGDYKTEIFPLIFKKLYSGTEETRIFVTFVNILIVYY